MRASYRISRRAAAVIAFQYLSQARSASVQLAHDSTTINPNAVSFETTDAVTYRFAPLRLFIHDAGRGFRAPSIKEQYFIFDHTAAGYVVYGGEVSLPPEMPKPANYKPLGVETSIKLVEAARNRKPDRLATNLDWTGAPRA